MKNDQTVLLLYLLLHKNESFQLFILRQKDLQSIVLNSLFMTKILTIMAIILDKNSKL